MPLAWIQTVTPEQLPRPPIRLNSFTIVTDPPKWLAVLQAESGWDPKFWRIRNGALKQEIETLRDMLEGSNQW